jgi:ABC-type nitrate/sulfonate/bicarbonate transport system ATPase subunit
LLNTYWREHRTTTLLVTHNLSEAADLSTRILILSPGEGKLVADCALPPPDPRLRNDRAVSVVLEELRRMAHAWPLPDSPEKQDTPSALSRVAGRY